MNDRKSILKGSFWAGIRFAVVMAKSILLMPFILSYWNKELYTTWILLAAANALYISIYDGYIRYVTNSYNLHFYSEPVKATVIIGGAVKFSVIANVLLLATISIGLFVFPGVNGFIFGGGLQQSKVSHLGLALVCFLTGNTVLNTIRFFYALNDPLGKLWKNFRFEVLYGIVELVVLLGSIYYISSFVTVVLINSLVYVLMSAVYFLLVRKNNPSVAMTIGQGTLAEGWKQFKLSGLYIVNNIIEKLATDSYSFMLAIFYYPAIAIRQFASMRTMTNAAVSGISIFQVVLVPKMQQYHAQRNNKELIRLFGRMSLLISGIMGTLIILFYPVLEQVYKIWTRGKIEWDATAFALMFACLLLALFGNTWSQYLKAVNQTKPVFAATIIKSVFLLVLAFFSSHSVSGAVIALIVVEFVVSVFVYPLMVIRLQKGFGYSFLVLTVLPFLIIVASILFYCFCSYSILSAVIIYAAFAVLLYVFKRLVL